MAPAEVDNILPRIHGETLTTLMDSQDSHTVRVRTMVVVRAVAEEATIRLSLSVTLMTGAAAGIPNQDATQSRHQIMTGSGALFIIIEKTPAKP